MSLFNSLSFIHIKGSYYAGNGFTVWVKFDGLIYLNTYLNGELGKYCVFS